MKTCTLNKRIFSPEINKKQTTAIVRMEEEQWQFQRIKDDVGRLQNWRG